MPVRKIPLGRRSSTGRFTSAKSGRQLSYESLLEVDFFTLLEFDPAVASFEEQPVRIEYVDETGCVRHYTPDVLVHFHPLSRRGPSRLPWLCEVKYADELADSWTELSKKVRAGRAFARARGWRFRVVTERRIRGARLENARFLLPYRRRTVDLAVEQQLLDRLEDLRETDPETLLAAVYSHPENRLALIPSLWRLVSEGRIGCDLAEPLTMASRIWDLGEGVRR